ncbi:MAG: aminodeoxychorismate/anthranilate synthase component II [Flavobacteriales bacterium]|jgi:anthranilate synthase component 2|nr:aminodeoxychorismate/anthranilate synthase component II [Flavobacteriales bacterium]
MKLLIIDNYDSFTFNLKHMCEPYVSNIHVVRNNQINVNDIFIYDKIIISPGPGLPQDAGLSINIINKFVGIKPILGVCLGAQAIAVAFDLPLYNLKNVMHGKMSKIKILQSNSTIYKGIPKEINVGRYHSWAVKINNEEKFSITSLDEQNTVMSFEHKLYPLTGIQYHPESVLTKYGGKILKNWLKI